jgi:5-methylcytosine-specific restriction endonuclease McrA
MTKQEKLIRREAKSLRKFQRKRVAIATVLRERGVESISTASDIDFLRAAYEALGWPFKPKSVVKVSSLHAYAAAIMKHLGMAKSHSSKPEAALRKPTRRRAVAKKLKKLPAFYESAEWRRLRYEVILEQGRKCAVCGRTPADGIIINVDHVRPLRKFPELALDKTNLQVLCHECNHGKGNWDETDWRAQSLTAPPERET